MLQIIEDFFDRFKRLFDNEDLVVVSMTHCDEYHNVYININLNFKDENGLYENETYAWFRVKEDTFCFEVQDILRKKMEALEEHEKKGIRQKIKTPRIPNELLTDFKQKCITEYEKITKNQQGGHYAHEKSTRG